MKNLIPMMPVTSSQMKEVGYDATTKTLAIRFNPTKKAPQGSVYTYGNVTEGLYQEFQAAESKGAFFGQRIKDHADKFPFTRVIEDEEETAHGSAQ